MHKLRYSLLLILFSLLIFSSSLFSETQKAILSYYKGNISIYRNNTLVYPEINMKILPGDSLETEKNSNLEITYEDGSVSTLEPNSVMTIRIIKKQKGLFKTRIKAWLGSVLCKVTKLRTGEKFEVYTPTAAASVRGTVFEAVVTEGKESSFNLLSGQLYAKAFVEGAKTYLLKDKFKYTVGIKGVPDIRKLSKKEADELTNRATAYIRDFIKEKKGEIKQDIRKKTTKGCLGFI